MEKYFVNCYTVDMAYGGNQEGGWWFEYGIPEKQYCKVFTLECEAVTYLNTLRETLAELNEERSPLSSVNCTGVLKAWLENNPAENYPEFYPQYS